jgi:beta-N-acetylhexosaminidase
MRLSHDVAPRRRLAALATGALAALIAGLAVGSAEEDQGSKGPEEAKQQRSEADRLDLRRQVGQLLISSFDGPTVPRYIRWRLRAGETAGVILFPRNMSTREGVPRLTGTLQRAARQAALVAVDQEGGSIRTVPFAGPVAAQSEQGDPAAVERQAHEAARELRRLGVNLNLAPVADVPSGPAPALAGRSFTGPPDRVAAGVRGAVRGLRVGDIAATAKHFPGMGAARANTDDVAVTIDAGPEELESRDLAPFRAAIEEQTPLVMAAHALYPAYDEERIASQSPAILGELLRRRLRFRGVVVTDSMEAEAVISRSGLAPAAIRSVEAGADLLLLTGSASWNEVFPALLSRARRSRAFRARINEAAGRVLELKRKLGLAR